MRVPGADERPPPDTHTPFLGRGWGEREEEPGRNSLPRSSLSLALSKAAADGARRTEGEQRALKAAVRRAEGGKREQRREREKEETKLFAPAVPFARSLVVAWTAVGRRDIRGEGSLRGAPTLDMNDSRRAATQEQGAAGVASSSSPLEGPEKRRKNRKGKGGAGKKGAPREESGPGKSPEAFLLHRDESERARASAWRAGKRRVSRARHRWRPRLDWEASPPLPVPNLGARVRARARTRRGARERWTRVGSPAYRRQLQPSSRRL